MASAIRLPVKSIASTTTLLLGGSLSSLNLRNLLLTIFTGPGSYSRILAFSLLLANLKNLPFIWHFRVYNAILKHFLFTRPKIPAPQKTGSLFLPVITSSHSPLWECDYNIHKSNSTYFSDLDVTRSHLVCCLFFRGIERLQHNAAERLVLDQEGKAVKGKWGISLGAVECSFRKEIKMYEGYEMWTRLLCWDRKWIYTLSHFVKKGAVKPKGYVLADGSWFGRGGYTFMEGKEEGGELDEKEVFATSISKYVVKLGRLTVHPEVMIQASDLLPPKPGGWVSMNGAKEVEGNGSMEVVEGGWDWKRVEAENEKGLKYAEHFAALDGLQKEFRGSEGPALGKYRDFLW